MSKIFIKHPTDGKYFTGKDWSSYKKEAEYIDVEDYVWHPYSGYAPHEFDREGFDLNLDQFSAEALDVSPELDFVLRLGEGDCPEFEECYYRPGLLKDIDYDLKELRESFASWYTPYYRSIYPDLRTAFVQFLYTLPSGISHPYVRDEVEGVLQENEIDVPESKDTFNLFYGAIYDEFAKRFGNNFLYSKKTYLLGRKFSEHEEDDYLSFVLAEYRGEYVVWLRNESVGGDNEGIYHATLIEAIQTLMGKGVGDFYVADPTTGEKKYD